MTSFLQYRPFFSVQMLIDYYLTEEDALYQDTPDNPMENVLQEQVNRYNLEQDILITPTESTKKELADKRLLFKRDRSGFFVSGQVRPTGTGFTPYVPLDEPFSLQFAAYLQNSYFYNFTNIRLESELADKDKFVYYFSNKANNIVNSNTLNLSRPVPGFDATYSYEASEIFIDATDPLNPEMFEAIENNGPGIFNPANWRQLFVGIDPLFQFVTNLDRIVLRPSVFKINVASAAEEKLAFLITDHKENEIRIIMQKTSETGTPLEECELDLMDLNPGYYELEVRDMVGNPFPELSLRFFMDDTLFQKRPFAIIECFHEPNGSLGEYRWLDESNQNRLRFPDYTIRWKNRATWWRYYHETTPDMTSTVLENLDPDVTSPNHRILISKDPLALTQLGREIPVTLSNGDFKLLPNPGVQMIYPENGRIYSELNMGGGFGPPE